MDPHLHLRALSSSSAANVPHRGVSVSIQEVNRTSGSQSPSRGGVAAGGSGADYHDPPYAAESIFEFGKEDGQSLSSGTCDNPPADQQHAVEGSEQVPASGSVAAQDSTQATESPSVKRGRGRPRKQKTAGHSGEYGSFNNVEGEFENNGAAQPVFVALGLADDPVVKKKRGRPKKFVTGDGSLPPLAIPPLQQVTMRKRGRPRGSSGVKRGRGRPPKPQGEIQNQENLVNVTFSTDPALHAFPMKRGRGRPKKNAPPGFIGMMPVKRPKKSSDRPVGRPRKNPYLLPGDSSHTHMQQSEGYDDMKKKLEFIQLKIMQAISVLKPEFGRQSSVLAIAAIQELEGLASMDVTAPFREEHFPPTEAEI